MTLHLPWAKAITMAELGELDDKIHDGEVIPAVVVGWGLVDAMCELTAAAGREYEEMSHRQLSDVAWNRHSVMGSLDRDIVWDIRALARVVSAMLGAAIGRAGPLMITLALITASDMATNTMPSVQGDEGELDDVPALTTAGDSE